MKRSEVQHLGAFPCAKSYDEIPEAPAEGVLIKTEYCGICHSDLHMLDGATANSTFPIVFGHEAAGTIQSFGENADRRGLKIGDKVMVYPWVGCGSCEECGGERHHFCMDRSQETGCGADGGYSNYVPVKDAKFLVKVPESVPMDVACMLPCSGLTSYSALEKVRPVLKDAKGKGSLLIVGVGGLGLWCLQWAKLRLPKGTNVVCADISEEKLKTASEYGADSTIVWSIPSLNEEVKDNELMAELKSKSNGGFDASIDFVNSSATSARAYDSLKKTGIHVAVGLFDGTITLQLQDVVRTVKTFRGSYTGSLRELRELVDLIASSSVKGPPIIHYDIADVAKAWELLEAGKMPGRAIIKHQ